MGLSHRDGRSRAGPRIGRCNRSTCATRGSCWARSERMSGQLSVRDPLPGRTDGTHICPSPVGAARLRSDEGPEAKRGENGSGGDHDLGEAAGECRASVIPPSTSPTASSFIPSKDHGVRRAISVHGAAKHVRPPAGDSMSAVIPGGGREAIAESGVGQGVDSLRQGTLHHSSTKGPCRRRHVLPDSVDSRFPAGKRPSSSG